MKLCVDCKHCRELVEGADQRFCYHPDIMLRSPDPVRGGERTIPSEAYRTRRFGKCGLSGKSWEAREP